MKKELIITKKNNSKINEYIVYKENQTYLNLDRISKELFEFESNVGNNDVCYNNRIPYDYNFCYSKQHRCHVVTITTNNVLYEYLVKNDKDTIKLSLDKCSFSKNETQYSILRYSNIQSINIKSKNVGINIEIKDIIEDERALVNFVSEINIDDNIKKIYNKIDKYSGACDNIKMKKYNILDTCDSREYISDIIIVENKILVDFLTTIEKNDKKYVIKKEGNDYSLKIINSSISNFNSVYYEMHEQVNFVKKLERCKETD